VSLEKKAPIVCPSLRLSPQVNAWRMNADCLPALLADCSASLAHGPTQHPRVLVGADRHQRIGGDRIDLG
jgi:hypothetical protein